jgi:hypothetical protein
MLGVVGIPDKAASCTEVLQAMPANRTSLTLALVAYAWYAGREMAARMAMTATTTMSSIKVNPFWEFISQIWCSFQINAKKKGDPEDRLFIR